jgi:hypothetical protein
MSLFHRRPRSGIAKQRRNELISQATEQRTTGDLDGSLALLRAARAYAQSPAEYGWMTGRMQAVYAQKVIERTTLS